MSIKNFYEIMDSSFLNTVDNPNYSLHHLKIPFRMAIVAASGSGKTNWLINLISLFSSGRKGTFNSITIVTKNKDEPLYNYLQSLNEGIIIKEGLESLPLLDKFDKELNHLVIIDDLVLSKNQSSVESYYIRCRKLNVSVIYISQSYFRIPKIIRSNLTYLVLLKVGGTRDLNMILSEAAFNIEKNTLIKMYEQATKDKFHVLLIDLEADNEHKYRHNFLQYLNPNDFKIQGNGVVKDIVSNVTDYTKAVIFGRDDYSPAVRKVLKTYGDIEIKSIDVCRNPLSKFTTTLINVVSLGEFNTALGKSNYDDLFHLFLIITLATGKQIRIEKNEVISISTTIKKSKNSKCIPVNITGKELSINMILDEGKKIQGNKFHLYDAINNNCQDFVQSLLVGSKINTTQLTEFIKQDVKTIFKDLTLTTKIAKVTTDSLGTLNTILKGKSV